MFEKVPKKHLSHIHYKIHIAQFLVSDYPLSIFHKHLRWHLKGYNQYFVNVKKISFLNILKLLDTRFTPICPKI